MSRADGVPRRNATHPNPLRTNNMSDTPEPVSDRTYPVLPIKNTVLFPSLFLPLSVGRPASRAAIDAALATEDKTLLVVAQRDNDQEAPGLADLFPVGTTAVIKTM